MTILSKGFLAHLCHKRYLLDSFCVLIENGRFVLLGAPKDVTLTSEKKLSLSVSQVLCFSLLSKSNRSILISHRDYFNYYRDVASLRNNRRFSKTFFND